MECLANRRDASLTSQVFKSPSASRKLCVTTILAGFTQDTNMFTSNATSSHPKFFPFCTQTSRSRPGVARIGAPNTFLIIITALCVRLKDMLQQQKKRQLPHCDSKMQMPTPLKACEKSLLSSPERNKPILALANALQCKSRLT